MKYITKSESETQNIGREFCKCLRSGDVVRLIGEPGAGKSVFVRGMAEELCIKEYITSPTFTIVNEYESGVIPLYHFDAYRLVCGDAEESGFDEYFYRGGICAVEWPENIDEIIPDGSYTVRIERDLNISDDYRIITIEKSL